MYICQSADDDSVIDETKNSRLQHVYRFKIPMHNNPWIKFSRTNYRQLNLHTDPNDVGVIMEIPPSTIFVHYIIRKNRRLANS